MIRRARQWKGDDSGSVLAIALVFLMIFGLAIGTTLQFAATGQRTQVQVTTEAATTYAADGALEGAINRLRRDQSVGTVEDGPKTCFTVPAGYLDTGGQIDVKCTPHDSVNTPANAVLATSLNASEGVSLSGAAQLPVRGSVLANKRVLVATGTSLTSTGTIKAATCTINGTTSPGCTTTTPVVPADLPKATSYPTPVDLAPVVCVTPVMKLKPGTYLDLSLLQAVFDCPNTVIWLTPGLYYFDFADTAGATATHELVPPAGSVVVGGTPSGWDPTSPTLVPGDVPDPSTGNATKSACALDKTGVNLVFGHDSRLLVSSSKVQLCALSTADDAQHIAMQALGTDIASLPGVADSTPLAATSTTWANPTGAMDVGDGQSASATVTGAGSASITTGPLTKFAVPTFATSISATVEVTETVTSSPTNRGTVTLIATPAGGPSYPFPLRTCSTKVCDGKPAVDTWTVTGVTPNQANFPTLALTVTGGGGTSTTNVSVDGVVVHFTYSAPMAATSGAARTAPYVRGTATKPVLRTTGTNAQTVFVVHGAIDTPQAAVDLGVTDVPYTVIDRGLVARHVESSMTPAAAFTGYLITLPAAVTDPRHVHLSATRGGVEIASAEVRLHDPADTTTNGTAADINAWFVN